MSNITVYTFVKNFSTKLQRVAEKTAKKLWRATFFAAPCIVCCFIQYDTDVHFSIFSLRSQLSDQLLLNAVLIVVSVAHF